MSDFDVEAARAMRASGASWDRVSTRFGVGIHVLRSAIDPGYAELRRAAEREAFQKRRGRETPGKIDHGRDYMSPEAKRDAYRRLAEIPADTRGVTARLMGDPLPGRRAIDKRQGG